jgi:hypothetical protein
MAQVDMVICADAEALCQPFRIPEAEWPAMANEAIDAGMMKAEMLLGAAGCVTSSGADGMRPWAEGSIPTFWTRRGYVAVRPELAGASLLEICDQVNQVMVDSLSLSVQAMMF